MPYSRTMTTVVPVDPDADLEVLRWLTRESFERVAAGEYLRLADYREVEVPAEDIPPKLAEQLGRPVEDFLWIEFTATAVRDEARLSNA